MLSLFLRQFIPNGTRYGLHAENGFELQEATARTSAQPPMKL